MQVRVHGRAGCKPAGFESPTRATEQPLINLVAIVLNVKKRRMLVELHIPGSNPGGSTPYGAVARWQSGVSQPLVVASVTQNGVDRSREICRNGSHGEAIMCHYITAMLPGTSDLQLVAETFEEHKLFWCEAVYDEGRKKK